VWSVEQSLTERGVGALGAWVQRVTGLPEPLMRIIGWLVACLVVVGVALFTVIYLIYVERKISAWIQSRIGPNRVGPHGLLQTVADALKLLLKEDIMPAACDRLLFTLAPIVCFMSVVVTLVVVPWDRDATPGDLSIGILFISAVASINVIGIMMAGWASNNKWSLLGGLRSAAQMVSYEIPQALALIGFAMWAGTLSLQDVGVAQTGWFWDWNIFRYWLWLPALIYFVASLAETNRTPFDLPEAESELVAGFHTEYTGMKFAVFFVSEYTAVFVVSLIFSTLFLGAWHTGIPALDAIVPGPVVMYTKAWAVVLVIMWLRWTLPRLRVDQLMGFAWKLLIPAALIAIAVVGLAMRLKGTY
jgi:NADH-quinone oxidoreductase subunit H